MEKECLCLKCLFGTQPYSYFPIVCVQGKHIKEMYHDVYNCKHFKGVPELPELPKQEPFKVIKCDESL